jgi:hypothetical protein
VVLLGSLLPVRKSAMTPPEFPDFSSVAASEISFS